MKNDRKHPRDFENLEDLRPVLGSNEDFYPTDAEVDRLMAGVDAEIESAAQVSPPEMFDNVTSVRGWWQRIAAMAAAVVLVLGTGWIGYRVGTSVDGSESLTGSQSVASGGIGTVDISNDNVSLDDLQVELLLREAVADDGSTLSDDLLGDLTEEEVEYLMESFDVGELLL